MKLEIEGLSIVRDGAWTQACAPRTPVLGTNKVFKQMVGENATQARTVQVQSRRPGRFRRVGGLDLSIVMRIVMKSIR